MPTKFKWVFWSAFGGRTNFAPAGAFSTCKVQSIFGDITDWLHNSVTVIYIAFFWTLQKSFGIWSQHSRHFSMRSGYGRQLNDAYMVMATSQNILLYIQIFVVIWTFYAMLLINKINFKLVIHIRKKSWIYYFKLNLVSLIFANHQLLNLLLYHIRWKLIHIRY